MKRPLLLSVVMAVLLLTGSSFAPCNAQNAATDDTPTFYRLTPGTDVNGWPRFTIHYPKDWVEETPLPQEVFRVADPRAYGDMYSVFVAPPNAPLFEKVADAVVSYFKVVAKDVTVVSDKPSQMRDGTPAQEVEIKAVLNGQPFGFLFLATKKSDMWFGMGLGSFYGVMRDDLKALLYSCEFQPSKDEPVVLLPDIQEFLDAWCSDVVSHDLAKVMAHYSDRYLHSGAKKGEVERLLRPYIGSITSYEVGITDVVPGGGKVFYITGFTRRNGEKIMLPGTSIIKENGEWKWYGNQREVAQ